MKNKHEIEIKLEKEWVSALDAVFKKKNKEVTIDKRYVYQKIWYRIFI